ncbi:(2Fe-2S) ferredoxin domain-containing protein [Fictibacillus enclensis]|uniref:(2Fe-2S) ferredoxin domain-containing protein n=1 Tax=Fictibacillus enclensis TaxID=1017270 RepID=UPI0025A18B0D|nr:(2Fe-2S) ferredoxin domain-containing protein [Fictibacillus enclensis]MDM5336353.1 (2Fe-2S) ferredoxin domain-containing protein [Fictibacillus enclensis]
MATWNFDHLKHHILVCNGSSCMRNEAEEVTQSIRHEITQKGLENRIHTTRTKCNGRCQDTCVVVLYPEGIWYKQFEPSDASSFVEALNEGVPHEQKVSHFYENSKFQRTNQTVKGVLKN